MIVCMRWLPTLMVGLMVSLMPVAELLAEAKEVLLTKPGAPPHANPVASYVVAFFLIILVSFAAWKSSKRTHQD